MHSAILFQTPLHLQKEGFKVPQILLTKEKRLINVDILHRLQQLNMDETMALIPNYVIENVIL